jgi:hypothetical protein
MRWQTAIGQEDIQQRVGWLSGPRERQTVSQIVRFKRYCRFYQIKILFYLPLICELLLLSFASSAQVHLFNSTLLGDVQPTSARLRLRFRFRFRFRLQFRYSPNARNRWVDLRRTLLLLFSLVIAWFVRVRDTASFFALSIDALHTNLEYQADGDVCCVRLGEDGCGGIHLIGW